MQAREAASDNDKVTKAVEALYHDRDAHAALELLATITDPSVRNAPLVARVEHRMRGAEGSPTQR